ncbi:hypothetical protein VNO80_16138 [Phaseolus coccineus]|uniref:Uncharacterized protein n=1 Tax=Phaseolus coccineus TaxID=3886 RepID=A0AAN9MSQ0_PHACN
MSVSQNNILAMSCREGSDVEEVFPLQVQRKDIVNTVQSKPIRSTQLHVGSSHFKLPHGWIVEERPRILLILTGYIFFFSLINLLFLHFIHSCKHNVSLLSSSSRTLYILIVAAYNVIISKALTDMNPTEYGKGQLLEEKTSIAIPKWAVKSDTGEKKVRGPRSCSSCRNRANKSAGKKPMKVDNQKGKSNSEKNKTPVHNLIGPPPDKVSWVLSGREGFWNPYVDGVAVSEAERLKWAEAFVLSIRARLDEDVLKSSSCCTSPLALPTSYHTASFLAVHVSSDHAAGHATSRATSRGSARATTGGGRRALTPVAPLLVAPQALSLCTTGHA